MDKIKRLPRFLSEENSPNTPPVVSPKQMMKDRREFSLGLAARIKGGDIRKPIDRMLNEHPEQLRPSLNRMADDLQSEADQQRVVLMKHFGCDPKGIGGVLPFFFTNKSRAFCEELQHWDRLEHLATRAHEIVECVAREDDPIHFHAAILGIAEAVLEAPLLLRDRINNPLFPGQKEYVVTNLSGLVAANTSRNDNPRLGKALRGDLQHVNGTALDGPPESLDDALLNQLPGAIILKARGWVWHEGEYRDVNNGDGQSLDDFRDDVANIIAGPERKTETRDIRLALERGNRLIDTGEQRVSVRGLRDDLADESRASPRPPTPHSAYWSNRSRIHGLIEVKDETEDLDDYLVLETCLKRAPLSEREEIAWISHEVFQMRDHEIASALNAEGVQPPATEESVKQARKRALPKIRRAAEELGYTPGQLNTTVIRVMRY